MKATIDQSGCIGCGLCVETCPEIFRMDDTGLAEVYNNITKETQAATEEARDNCPTEVIRIEE